MKKSIYKNYDEFPLFFNAKILAIETPIPTLIIKFLLSELGNTVNETKHGKIWTSCSY